MEERASYLRHINTNIYTNEHRKNISYTSNYLYLVVEGNGFLKIKDQIHSLAVGQAFFLPRGCQAAYFSDGNAWKYIWIQFDEWALFDEILSKTAFSLDNPVCNTTEEQQKLFNEILDDKWKLRNGNRYQTVGLAIQLLSSFIETFPSAIQLQEDASFQSLLSFIDANLCRPDLNLDMLVQASGYSRPTLHNRFKKEVGCSPGTYIRKRRMHKARHMIYSTDLPINQVARAVGYEDALYFSRLFRRETGDSPTKHRKGCRAHDPSSRK